MAEIEVSRVTALPEGIDTLRAESMAEGYDHIEVLWSQWQDGSKRFELPGEMLAVAHIAGVLAGIGGVTEDFIDTTALRMRRFYVRPAFRRDGVGRALARFVLDAVAPLDRQIVLFAASPDAARFWETLGFVPIEREKTTHALAR